MLHLVECYAGKVYTQYTSVLHGGKKIIVWLQCFYSPLQIVYQTWQSSENDGELHFSSHKRNLPER